MKNTTNAISELIESLHPTEVSLSMGVEASGHGILQIGKLLITVYYDKKEQMPSLKIFTRGLNPKYPTNIEQKIWDILSEYGINEMQQSNITTLILNECDKHLNS